jgi:threonine aldolase
MRGCSPNALLECAGSASIWQRCRAKIVIFRMAEGAPDAATIVARAQQMGVLVSAFAARTLRAVTHLDVSREQCRQAAGLLARVIEKS